MLDMKLNWKNCMTNDEQKARLAELVASVLSEAISKFLSEYQVSKKVGGEK